MRRFPRLVEHFRTGQSLRLGCNACGKSFVGTFDEGTAALHGLLLCPNCGENEVVWAYEEATRCKGCGRMGHYFPALDDCCSVRCQLQAEYAVFLRERIKDAVSLLPWRGYSCG